MIAGSSETQGYNYEVVNDNNACILDYNGDTSDCSSSNIYNILLIIIKN